MRNVFCAIGAILWIAAGWLELQLGPLLSIPLPYRALPIPVVFWTGWLVYAFSLTRLWGGSWRVWLAQTFWRGLGAHGLLLVLDLDRFLRLSERPILESGYFAYYQLVLALLLVGLGFGLARMQVAWAVPLPLMVSGVSLVSYLVITGQWGILLAGGIGVLIRRYLSGRHGWIEAGFTFLRSSRGIALGLWVIAWLVRWVYAIRLVATTGDDFIYAGDDSNANNEYALAFAQDPSALFTIDPMAQYPPGYCAIGSIVNKADGS